MRWARQLAPSGESPAHAQDNRIRHSGRRARLAAPVLVAVALLAVALGALAPAQGSALAGDAAQLEPSLGPTPTLVSPAAPGARFGSSIALSDQGTTAIVGAPVGGPGGTAWIYVRSGDTWSRQGPPLTPLEGSETCVPGSGHESGICRFGVSVALSADGNIALIGAPAAHGGEGLARLYTRSGTSWAAGTVLHAQGQSPTGHFGRSVALSADGATALVGEPSAGVRHHGAAWIFTGSGESWSSGTELQGAGEVGSAYFGSSVALSADAGTALVGGPYDNQAVGAAWVFADTESGWSAQGPKLTPEAVAGRQTFGFATALSADGSTALIGAPSSGANVGAAYVFTRSDGTWSQQAAAMGPAVPFNNGRLGISVALTGDGERALVGGNYKGDSTGTVWDLARSGTTWSEQGQALLSSKADNHAHLGTGLALAGDGSTALAGAPRAEAEAGGVWSLFETQFAAPTITSVEPDSGPTTGGTRVTITGSGFLPGATVTIGAPAGEVEVVSATEIKATTAPGEPGAEEVLVADDGGAMSTGPAFTYLSPTTPTPPGQTGTGGSNQAKSGALASIESKFPPPVLGVSGNLDPVLGHIRVKLPGSHVWVSITTLTQIPFGTIVDARHGKVTITTVGPTGKVQQISFFSGMFKLLQNKKTAEVVAVLEGGSFASCPRIHGHAKQAEAATSRKHIVRKLWASGHGSYTTKGSYAAGAVVGTKWLTADRCDGTFIYVATDAVSVTNLLTHRHVLVKTHRSYLAPAR